MAVVPHAIDIVVADIGAALAFYRELGLDAPADTSGKVQVEFATPGGTTIGLVAETMVRTRNPGWVTPVGQRVTFSCRCDSPDEVDAVYARVTSAGHVGLKEPGDAFRGQRYAFLKDPGRKPGRPLRGSRRVCRSSGSDDARRRKERPSRRRSVRRAGRRGDASVSPRGSRVPWLARLVSLAHRGLSEPALGRA